MYGNQQNLPKVAKKSDPNLPVMPPSDKDRSGSVEAEPAHDIKPSVEGDMSNNQNGVETVESELTNVGSTDSKSAEEEPQVSESKTSEESEADFVKNLPPEEAEAIKELEEAEKAQKEGDSKENNESDQSKEEENSTNEQDQSNALNRYSMYIIKTSHLFMQVVTCFTITYILDTTFCVLLQKHISFSKHCPFVI